MKKILVAAGLVGAATAGILLYMRNRNKTSKALHQFADEAGNVHEKVRKYFRKANHEAKRDFEDAIA